MSESEFRKIRLHLRLLTFCVVVLIALLTANLIHRNFSPKSISFPKIQVVQGPSGKDATIDYNAIDQYALAQIQAQIAALPKPQNGVNGQPSQSIIGPQGAQGIPGVQGATGASIIGPQGEPGAPGKEIELRYNPAKQETEWRYAGDFGWEVLFQNCQILGTC